MLPHHLTEIGTLGLMVFTVASVVWRATRDEPAVRLPAAEAEPEPEPEPEPVSPSPPVTPLPRHLTSPT